jgi:hypothetical protein
MTTKLSTGRGAASRAGRKGSLQGSGQDSDHTSALQTSTLSKSDNLKPPALGSFRASAQNTDFSNIVSERDIEPLKEIVRSSIERDRELLVRGVVSALKPLISSNQTAGRDTGLNQPSIEWIGIDSLSRLRAEVGGRFQNLKDRWIEAGFSLKEHRGDKSQKVEINKSGWLELSNWISGQGYEVKLVSDRVGILFEIRKR